MSKEILLVVDMVSNEKGVAKEVIFNALECALVSATKKRHIDEINVRVSIDRMSGEYTTFRQWEVVATEDYLNDAFQIPIDEAQAKDASNEIGQLIEEKMDSIAFGRIAAQTARQVIVQKVREAEREQVVEAYHDRIGQLISGTVKRLDKGNVILDLGNNAEAIIPREELIAREVVRPNDRIRGYLQDVRSESRGPQLFMSRVAPELLIQLFKLEVPEIGENLISILGAARDPGSRAKIAVYTEDPRIDPVGACVGMRGSRVQAVSNELNGERVDIILWDENPAKYVINAMSPSEIASIVIDEDLHSMDVAVEEDQLSLAIGRGGQNVRLASQLTGWTLNVISSSEADQKHDDEYDQLSTLFIEKIDIDEGMAEVLIEEGFSSLEEIAYVPIDEMLAIDGFDEEVVLELRRRAKEALSAEESSENDQLGDKQPAQELLDMDGMDEALAYQLAKKDIVKMDDLAEQSVDELMEIEGMDETRAAELIMTARAPWFADEE